MQPLNNFMCCTLSQEVKQLFFWLLDMLPPSRSPPSLRLYLCLIIWSFVGLFVYTSPSYCMWVQFSWVSFFLPPSQAVTNCFGMCPIPLNCCSASFPISFPSLVLSPKNTHIFTVYWSESRTRISICGLHFAHSANFLLRSPFGFMSLLFVSISIDWIACSPSL